MFPTENNPITLTDPIRVTVIADYSKYMDTTSNDLYVIIDPDQNEVIRSSGRNISNNIIKHKIYIEKNIKGTRYNSLPDGYTGIIDTSKIIIPNKYSDLYIEPELKSYMDGLSYFPSIVGANMQLPENTKFFISYIKLGKTLSKNVGTKIRVLSCPNKELNNKSLFLSNDILDHFTFVN